MLLFTGFVAMKFRVVFVSCCLSLLMLIGWNQQSQINEMLRKQVASDYSTPKPHDESLVSHDQTNETHVTGCDRTSVSCQQRFPSVLIIGAGKCGTGTLTKFMGYHPNIQSKTGEMNFFRKYYHRGEEWYKAQMPFSEPDQLTAVKTAGYVTKAEVPQRIYDFNKSMKLLLIIREPTHRIVSSFSKYVLNLSKDAVFEPIEEELLLPNGEIGGNYATNILCYGPSIGMWLDVFPRKQLHIVDGEIMITNPYTELKKVETFLDVPAYFQPRMFVFNETKGFYCFKRSNQSDEECMNSAKGIPHVEIAEQLMTKMRDFARACNRNLSQITGQQFSWQT